MKRLIILLMTIITTFCCKNMELSAQNSNSKSKISVKLQEQLDLDKSETTVLAKICNTIYQEVPNEEDTYNLVNQAGKVSIKDAQELLKRYRKSIKQKNEQTIMKYIEKLDKKFNIGFVSDYTPYFVVKGDYNDIMSLSKENNICELNYLNDDYEMQSHSFDISDLITDEMLIEEKQYKNTTNINYVKNNYNLSGKNIIIGILEGGTVNGNNIGLNNLEYHNEYPVQKVYYEGGYINHHDHTTTVALVAAGNQYGIANDSLIVSYGLNFDNNVTASDIFTGLEALNSQGANIINMSFGSHNGDYDEISRYLDYFVTQNKVVLVASAGNQGGRNVYDSLALYNSNLINNLGMASNVITVGSTNIAGNYLSTFSSTSSNENIPKPTIVAPGGQITTTNNKTFFGGHNLIQTCEGLLVPNSPYSSSSNECIYGTSLSSPNVAGAIALMMEYDPQLALNPEDVISLITAGASNESLEVFIEDEYPNEDIRTRVVDLTFDNSSNLSNESGAGLLDLKSTFKIMENNSTIDYSTNDSNGIIDTFYVKIFDADKVTLSHFFIRNQEMNNELTLQDIDIRISYNGTTIVQTSGDNSNLELIEFNCVYGRIYTVEVIVRKNDNCNDSSCQIKGSISIKSDNGYNLVSQPTTPSTC